MVIHTITAPMLFIITHLLFVAIATMFVGAGMVIFGSFAMVYRLEMEADANHALLEKFSEKS
jgi:hypothetical protein